MQVEKGVSAGIFRRLLAFIADIFIVDIFFTTPFRSIIMERLPDASFASLKGSLDPLLVMTGMLIFIFFFLYASILQYKLGQTIGQMVFGLRVTSIGSSPMTAWQVLVRNMFLIPVFPIFFLWIFDPIHLLLRKTRLSELMSGTQTIEIARQML